MAWLTGYPRDKIDWFPTIDREKCVKCAIYITCAKYTEKTGYGQKLKDSSKKREN